MRLRHLLGRTAQQVPQSLPGEQYAHPRLRREHRPLPPGPQRPRRGHQAWNRNLAQGREGSVWEVTRNAGDSAKHTETPERASGVSL